MAVASIGGSTVPLNPNPTPGPAPGTRSGDVVSYPTPSAGPTPAPPPYHNNGSSASFFLQIIAGGIGGSAGTALGAAASGGALSWYLGAAVGTITASIGDGSPAVPGINYNVWDGSQYVQVNISSATDPGQFNVTGSTDSSGNQVITVIQN